MSNTPQQPRQIFLGNISYDATPREILALLQAVGIHGSRVRLATWKDTGAPRGFGFLDLAQNESRSTQEVINLINLTEIVIDGRTLRASIAHSKTAKPKHDEAWRSRGRGCNEFQGARHEFDSE